MRIRSPILTAVGLAALALAPAAQAQPVASFRQVTPGAPFVYDNGTGSFTAITRVSFNFLAANSSGVDGAISATLVMAGATTGPVTQFGPMVIESVAPAAFAIVADSGPLQGMTLLSGRFTGVIVGMGGALGLRGSQSGGDVVILSSDFMDLTSSVNRGVSFSLAGVANAPLTQSGDNLSGTPAPSGWAASISGGVAAGP